MTLGAPSLSPGLSPGEPGAQGDVAGWRGLQLMGRAQGQALTHQACPPMGCGATPRGPIPFSLAPLIQTPRFCASQSVGSLWPAVPRATCIPLSLSQSLASGPTLQENLPWYLLAASSASLAPQVEIFL